MHLADKNNMTIVADVMTRDIVTIEMDTPLGKAMEICSDKKIRHLLILDEQKHLVGVVTDRDLQHFISPRVGTISENSVDRETLKRPVHLIMAHEAVVTDPESPIAEAADLMLNNRVGCLPVVDSALCVVGLITSTDLIRFIAKGCTS
jgi:acetoin utilization protein AcuB